MAFEHGTTSGQGREAFWCSLFRESSLQVRLRGEALIYTTCATSVICLVVRTVIRQPGCYEFASGMHWRVDEEAVNVFSEDHG